MNPNQVWKCTKEIPVALGPYTRIDKQYAKTIQDKMILEDMGYKCEPLIKEPLDKEE